VIDREKIKGEISHHISPLIGWLRNDASKGIIDVEGVRHDQWLERLELATVAITDMINVEPQYEYALQRAWVGNGVWQEILADDWVSTLEEANYNLEHALKLDAHYGELGENKYYDYRIVKRLAPGEIEAV
jgi:hypothetical protein